MTKAPERKMIIALPDDERGRSASDIRRFDRIVSNLTRPRDRPLTEAQRDAMLKHLANIEAEPQADRERAWLERVQAETTQLEQLRGGTVEIAPSGQMRVDNRDGLFALLRIKDPITADQWDAGMKYREGYELREEDMRSGLGASGGAGHDNNRFVRSRLIRAAKLATMGRIEIEVGLKAIRIGEPKLVEILASIAGAGMTVNAYCMAHRRGFPRILKALKIALDVADGVVRAR